jgi:hypothetical protein
LLSFSLSLSLLPSSHHQTSEHEDEDEDSKKENYGTATNKKTQLYTWLRHLAGLAAVPTAAV